MSPMYSFLPFLVEHWTLAASNQIWLCFQCLPLMNDSAETFEDWLINKSPFTLRGCSVCSYVPIEVLGCLAAFLLNKLLIDIQLSRKSFYSTDGCWYVTRQYHFSESISSQDPLFFSAAQVENYLATEQDCVVALQTELQITVPDLVAITI